MRHSPELSGLLWLLCLLVVWPTGAGLHGRARADDFLLGDDGDDTADSLLAELSEEEEATWIPTAEDIAYQDSMYQIIKSTQNDLTDIKKDIVHILERLDYADGTYDSIRYVKGGAIDKRRNK